MFNNLQAYILEKEERLEDLKSVGYVFKHKKSGARVVIISNDDDNKVFSIGFRTPPSDSTGVPHIIEHSVLCGSKEFPSKDPFVELVKGSLNTFLNAMTYSDKTIYPVASCNAKDFQNLMHVYLDAVFYPNIYKREEIFMQEGWHYEMEDAKSELTLNGVVYNEMKGVFSSPEQQLFRLIQQSLFPDTTYGTESGGDPDYIPDLSYDEFLAFHKKFYHPSNSYVYLYGDLDIEEKLSWMDEKYLSKFDEIAVDSEIKTQASFHEVRELVDYYSISEEESPEDKTYLSYNTVVGTSLDVENYLAFQIIDYVLLSAPGAPLKQALLDANIGKDVLSSYDNGIKQPVFSIISKNTSEEKKDEFLKIIRETILKLSKEGFEEKSLKAAINYFEFKYREADFGSYPKGLMYGIQILDSWLYDDNKPFIHLCANETFEFLKRQIGTGYFEKLMVEYFIDNPHASVVIVKPMKGLTAKKEDELKEKLEKYKTSLSKEEINKIVNDTKHLKAYQEEPSPKEDLEKIPLLGIEDIGKKVQPLLNDEKDIIGNKVLHHNVFTNGISYIRLLFDISDLPTELILYAGLLTNVLGLVDTKNYKYLDYSNEVNMNTGGITTDVTTFSKVGKIDEYEAKFLVRTKILYDNTEKAFDLIKEMLLNTIVTDDKRLKEIIDENKSRLQMRLMSSGHTAAVNRSMAYMSKSGLFNELISGISYYQWIEHLSNHYGQVKDDLIDKLELTLSMIFRKENLMISYTGDDKGYDIFANKAEKFIKSLSQDQITSSKANLSPQILNEGFKTSSKVQYVARTGNYLKKGFSYTGTLKVLKLILSYDYLWNNVRVKGGAYGSMCGFGYDGSGFFTSYRDPNLSETNTIYEKVPEYIKTFEPEQRDMTKYIIGTISNLDTPLNPSAKGSRSLTAYLSGVTEADLQKERDEVLSANPISIRSLASLVESILACNCICVIGNEGKVTQNKQLFKEVKPLIKD